MFLEEVVWIVVWILSEIPRQAIGGKDSTREQDPRLRFERGTRDKLPISVDGNLSSEVVLILDVSTVITSPDIPEMLSPAEIVDAISAWIDDSCIGSKY